MEDPVKDQEFTIDQDLQFTSDLLACVREAQKLDQDYFPPEFNYNSQPQSVYASQPPPGENHDAYANPTESYAVTASPSMSADIQPSHQPWMLQDNNQNVQIPSRHMAHNPCVDYSTSTNYTYEQNVSMGQNVPQNQANLPQPLQNGSGNQMNILMGQNMNSHLNSLNGMQNEMIAKENFPDIQQSRVSMTHDIAQMNYDNQNQYFYSYGQILPDYQTDLLINSSCQSLLQQQSSQCYYESVGSYLETLHNSDAPPGGQDICMLPTSSHHENGNQAYRQDAWDLNMSGDVRSPGDGWKDGSNEDEEERGFIVNNSESDSRIREGFILVNKQNYSDAILLFNEILTCDPNNVKALVGRGTANAMSKNLKSGEDDFSQAIKVEPEVAESWKRRGQVRAALGRNKEALEDLEKSQTLLQDLDVEIQKEIALLYQNMGDNESAVYYFQNADQLLRLEDELDPTLAKSIWNAMGLALNSLGRSAEAVNIYQKALQAFPDFKAAHINIAQAYKELANISKAVTHFNKGLSYDPHCVISLNLRGLTEHSIGLIRDAYSTFTKALKISPDHMETLHMHGVCAHGLGWFREAIHSYDVVLKQNPKHFTFYLHEMALFTHHNLDRPLKEFNLDHTLDDCFKESWTKKLPPTDLSSSYKRQPEELNRNIPDVEVNRHLPKEAADIVKLAALFGSKNQYNSVGFVHNMKQHRWAGLAIVEIAQTVRQVWYNMRTQPNIKDLVLVPGSCSSSCQLPHTFNWRDMYDIAVKWRQMSEPLDSVWWIDLLNPDAFSEGFGSQTPMTLGQNRVVRYYPYFKRAFHLIKKLLPEQIQLTPEQLQYIEESQTCRDIHNTVKQDFCVVTPCPSHALIGRVMEGTHLTVTKTDNQGYTCSIRTPCTPSRWELFSEEMAHAWKLVCEESTRNDVKLENLVKRIVHLVYYWYNFMPLTRGSAACGLVSIHALLLAAGWEITAPIPHEIQWDWEAIFHPSPEEFQKIIMAWIMPNLKRVRSDVLTSIGQVTEVMPTMRHMIHVLNHQMPEDRLKVIQHDNSA